MSRACVIVLDAVGAGELPDAAEFGDEGSDTLGNVARAVGGLDLPTLEAFGLGNVKPLYVRVDVDEHEASHVHPEAPATATLRGDASIRSSLRFVRFEPLVVPKRALTGDSAERVDTRVLQVLYRIERSDSRFFVGQQMDVFIDGAKGKS